LTIKDEILRKFREGIPLGEVQKQFRSQSQLYEAIREFLEEADKIVEERQERMRKAEEDLLNVDSELQRIDAERSRFLEEVTRLKQTREATVTELGSLTEKRDSLRGEIKKLEANGFTPQIMKKLKTIEARCGTELVLQVETAEKYIQLRREFSCLEKRAASLKDEIRVLETKKKSIEQSTVSEKNRLDELRVQTASFKESVEITESLLKEGYSTEDIRSLKHGLDVLGIKGEPHASVTRIVNGLAKLRTLLDLEERLCRKKEELAALNRDVESVKNELETAKAVTLKTIEDVRGLSVQAIANTAQQSNDQMKQTTEKLEAKVTESLGKMDAQIQQATEIYKAEVKEITEIERRRAEAEEALGPGLVLVGMLRSHEYLKMVPVTFMVQLLERIQLWCEISQPGFSVMATQSINAKDCSLVPFLPYRLSVLIELAKEGLKQRMMQQKA